jgi:hypothetical protein
LHVGQEHRSLHRAIKQQRCAKPFHGAVRPPKSLCSSGRKARWKRSARLFLPNRKAASSLIFVLRPVSSRKTSRSSSQLCFWLCHRERARATSAGRFCSAARSAFFFVAVGPRRFSRCQERGNAQAHVEFAPDAALKLGERQIGLLFYPAAQGFIMAFQARTPVATALFGLKGCRSLRAACSSAPTLRLGDFKEPGNLLRAVFPRAPGLPQCAAANSLLWVCIPLPLPQKVAD